MSTIKCNSLEDQVKLNLLWLCDGNNNKTDNKDIVKVKCCNAYKVHKSEPGIW